MWKVIDCKIDEYASVCFDLRLKNRNLIINSESRKLRNVLKIYSSIFISPYPLELCLKNITWK